MRNFIFTTLVLLLSIMTFGQDDIISSETNKFRFRSIETGVGVYGARFKKRINQTITDSNSFRVLTGPESHVGSSLSINTSFEIHKNILSLGLHIGYEFEILGGENDFLALNILYGREWELARLFTIEIHAGAGLYSSQEQVLDGSDINSNINYLQKEVLGIPIDVKFLFYPAKRFALGFNPSINFNSINTTYSGSMIFLYKFN